jgi:hypothetical protein
MVSATNSLIPDLLAALDPAVLMQRAGLTPDRWQSEVLRSAADRIALCCNRQAGKSTVSAALALHTALYQPPALVLLLSPSLRQSQELFKIVTRLHAASGTAVPLQAESALRMRGATLDVPEHNHGAALMDAFLTPLTQPTFALTPAQLAAMRGPRVLRPT